MSGTNRILQAVAALQAFDRDNAVALLSDELRHGPSVGDRWKSIGLLASKIGEIDIAIECAHRYSRTEPPSLARSLHYWGELAAVGRSEQALTEAAQLPPAYQENPGVLHFLGTIAGEQGDFTQAEEYYRRALASSPYMPQTWFALAMIKKFTADDPDLAAMERFLPVIARAEPSLHARFLYGLAKALDDCGDQDRAFALYAQGAELRRREAPYRREALENFADALIHDFTPEAMQALYPSQCRDDRTIFINGLPRSGTTLTEQILVSHSQVTDGGEINLFRSAAIPAGDYSYAGALRYQERAGKKSDPWGGVARTYARLVTMRFGSVGRIVDKTLGQSHLMGLILHTMPDAPVIWMRRSPEDTALSCFRSYFTSPLPWTWALEDIAHFFKIEDRLYRHWSEQFPGRILTVPYEELVREPDIWIPKILTHAGLVAEPQIQEFHKNRRSVRTASVQQVRAPISASRIGLSKGYDRHMAAFRDAYYLPV